MFKARLLPFTAIPLLILALAIGALFALGTVFAKGPVTYDFNNLDGDNSPFVESLDGQDHWTSNGFIFNNPIPSWFVGVSDDDGFDGTQALIFTRVGSGYGADASRVNDGSFSFKKVKKQAYFQADFGVSYWGGSFGLANDADEDGVIRKTDFSEIDPQIIIDCNTSVIGVRVLSATGTLTEVPLSAVSGACGDWIRLRLVMDLDANTGSAFYQNLTDGDTVLMPVVGLQNIDLQLDELATDATNPENWNAMWLHFEGSKNELDNIAIDHDFKAKKVKSCKDDDGSSGGSSGSGSSSGSGGGDGPTILKNDANGHCYEEVSVPGGISWGDAHVAAAALSIKKCSGHLATITSAEENVFVITNFPQAAADDYWLGGFQQRSSGSSAGWLWVTGEPFDYTNWNPSEPNGGGSGGEDSLQYWANIGKWNDRGNTNPAIGYVVEYSC
jgi:hypothetical protein